MNDEESLLAEIVKYTAPPRKEEGEFTLRDYQDEVERQGGGRISYSKAKDDLEGLVAGGKLAVRRVLVKGIGPGFIGERMFVIKGGRGSGHYGHAGRPRTHGGSLPGGGRLGLNVVAEHSRKDIEAGRVVTVYNRGDGRIDVWKKKDKYRGYVSGQRPSGRGFEISIPERPSLGGVLAWAEDYFVKVSAAGG